jgi:hypothetical protein
LVASTLSTACTILGLYILWVIADHSDAQQAVPGGKTNYMPVDIANAQQVRFWRNPPLTP